MDPETGAPSQKEVQPTSKVVQETAQGIFKPFLEIGDSSENAEQRETYLQAVAGKDVQSIIGDPDLNDDQKVEKMGELRHDVMFGAIEARRNPNVGPAEFVNRMTESMRKAKVSPDLTRQRLGTELTGYLAGCLALNGEASVRAVQAIVEIGKLQGKTPDQAMGEYSGILTQYRHQFDGQNLERRQDGQVVQTLDSFIREKSGYIWRSKEPGSRDQLYAPPFAQSSVKR